MKIKNFFYLLLFSSNIFCYDIVLVPFDENASEQAFFYKDGIWEKLKYALEKKGHKLFLYSNHVQAKKDIIVTFNLHEHISEINKFKKKILYIFEPPSVDLEQYKKEKHKIFDIIATWQDDLVDGKKYVKFYCPQYIFIEPDQIKFEQKKFCVMVNSNKPSRHECKDELYSERVKSISFFEKHYPNEFDLYGFYWPQSTFRKTYRGPIDDKIGILKEYKYIICYENMTNINGYVSEKIFHAFQAGCVPIYWGATNILDFVPKNCFIDRRDFGSDMDLYIYLKNLSEHEYKIYLDNAKLFMSNYQASVFSWDSFIEKFLKFVENI